MYYKLSILTFLFWFSSTAFAQTFTEQGLITLPGAYNGSVSWADFDNDNDLDFLLTGRGYFNLYKNNGNNTFSLQTGLPFPSVYNTSVDWGDFNNDGFLDILITGELVGGRYTTIFKNNGSGSFLELAGNGLTPMLNSSAVWGDYDNDGFIDVLLSGSSINGDVTKIFRNNGNETFTEKTEIKIIGLYNTSAAWGDYDNDGFLDFILTGSNNTGYYTRVYKNDRKGNFTEQTALGLTGVRDGSAIWGDYDNDGLLDIFVSGHTGSSYLSKIYKNNGNGTFSAQNGISIMGQRYGHTAWGDLNNDGYLDIILTGSVGLTDYTKIYINNKDNTFSELSGIPIPGITNGCVALGDYDNDLDLDILVMGFSSSTSLTKIYRNEISTSNEAPLLLSELSEDFSSGVLLKWTDGLNLNKGLSYNVRVGKTSGASDVVTPSSSVTGFFRKASLGNAQTNQSFLIPNLKKGTYYWSVQAIDNSFIGGPFAAEKTFTYNLDNPASHLSFTAKTSTSVKCQWMRGNGDKCALFVKENGNDGVQLVNNTTYTGNKNFTSNAEIATSSGWYCVYNGEADTATIYNLKANTKYRFHVIEYSGNAGAEIYYTTSGIGNPAQYIPHFTEETQITLTGVSSHTKAWGDYDNDGDLDIILGGNNGTSQVVELYTNNGDNTFTKSSATFDVNTVYDIQWGDYDNDNDLDLLILSSFNSKVFENKGDGTFTAKANLADVFTGKGQWADFNNDGFKDIIFTGTGGTKIYKNNHDGTFTIQTHTLPTVSNYSAVACGDYDNDGDLDVLLSGLSGSAAITKVFKNNGNFSFAEQTTINNLPGISNCAVQWADMDNDGDLDIIMSGADYNFATKIYDNNGNNTFTEIAGPPFKELYRSSLAIADYDNDGYRDLLVSGSNNGDDYYTILYHNNGNKTYTEFKTLSLPGIQYGSLNWGDYDNDHDLDLFMCGTTADGKISKIFRNNGAVFNTKPGNVNFNYSLEGNNVRITWNRTSDDKTVSAGLSYNLYVYEKTKSAYNLSGEAFPYGHAMSGRKLMASFGNIQYSSSGYTLKGLPAGSYKFCMQAIDAGMGSSSFSTEMSFSFYDLTKVGINVATSQITNTNSDMEYSINTTDGVNGTWNYCFDDNTNVNFAGGIDVWVREEFNTTNKRKVATIPAADPAPTFTINYLAETTTENVPETIEAFTHSSMTGVAVNGTGNPMQLRPGLSYYIRTKATANKLASKVLTLIVPARPVRPTLSIDYAAEKTVELIPTTMEYASTIEMNNPSFGSGEAIQVTPGQALYFRTKATKNSFCSDIYTLSGPVRPFTPNFSFDYINETTDNIESIYEYSDQQNMANAVTGNGSRVSVNPGQNLYIRIKATSNTFSSLIQTLKPSVRPEAPSNLVVNDGMNTLDWSYIPNYALISDYEYSLDGGSVWTVCNSKPLEIGNINVNVGNAKIRLKATSSSFRSLEASSTSAFTITTDVKEREEAGIKMYPVPVNDILFLENLPENSFITIFNLSGKLVYQLQTEDSNVKIPVNDMPQGMYLLKITNSKGEFQSKFSRQ